MDTKPIAFADDGRHATRELLRHFDELAVEDVPRDPDRIDLRARLETLDAIDRQYGGRARLALEDLPGLIASILQDLASFGDADLVIGTALWAIRHDVPIEAPEPVVNALAERSNTAASKQQLAAVIAIMEAVIDNVRPRLGPDLERSNPERAWRILHANLAITAIRTEEPPLMDAAFDALDAALPDERDSFYGEALALALAPGISPVVRERIEARRQGR
ncbi:MAG: hypothetical protein H7Y14_10715 [Burkholderiales bacterium]|nr:hypothetical protein [Burkholderiales bacterium]